MMLFFGRSGSGSAGRGDGGNWDGGRRGGFLWGCGAFCLIGRGWGRGVGSGRRGVSGSFRSGWLRGGIV